MTQPKTTLIQGVGWPEVGEWPTRFEHKEKPKRVIQKKPKVKAEPKPAPKPKAQDICEVKVKDGVFQHPKQGRTLKRPSLEPKQIFYFSKARSST